MNITFTNDEIKAILGVYYNSQYKVNSITVANNVVSMDADPLTPIGEHAKEITNVKVSNTNAIPNPKDEIKVHPKENPTPKVIPTPKSSKIQK